MQKEKVIPLGDTKGIVVGGSTKPEPSGPRVPMTFAVSTLCKVESVTIKATEPQPARLAVKLPPLVVTMLGVTDATAGSGDATM